MTTAQLHLEPEAALVRGRILGILEERGVEITEHQRLLAGGVAATVNGLRRAWLTGCASVSRQEYAADAEHLLRTYRKELGLRAEDLIEVVMTNMPTQAELAVTRAFTT